MSQHNKEQTNSSPSDVIEEGMTKRMVDGDSEDFIPVEQVQEGGSGSDVNNGELMSDDRTDDEEKAKMDYEENAAVYEKKIPKALIELKKIFPDEFDFEKLKNMHGVKQHEALEERIEKVIVQEGTGVEATQGSIIRYMEACITVFKRNEYSDWEYVAVSSNLLQENRLRLNKVPPVFLKCIHTLKVNERAYFKIHKDLYPELKITCRDPIQDDVETTKLLDVTKCYDYFGVQYINMTFLELKEVAPPKASFSDHLDLIIKKRLEGNVHFKELSIPKALKSYNAAIFLVNDAKFDEGKVDEQKQILKEERVKILVNIAKCNSSINNEKNQKTCLTNCENILSLDPENYNAHYLKAKTYNFLDDYSRGLECIAKAKQLFSEYQQKNDIDPVQQKKDALQKSRMDTVETLLLRKKKVQEEKDNKIMKSKMSNMFSEVLYADVEPYDEEEYWRKQQEEDERLGRKPWFMSDGTIHYQQL